MLACRNKPVTQKKVFIMKGKKVIQIDSLRADYNEKQSAKIFPRPNNKAQEAAAQYLAIKQYNRKLDALVTFGYVSLFVLVGVFASLIMGAL